MQVFLYLALGFLVLFISIALYDILQRKHTILRNFPLIGHLRYVLETTYTHTFVSGTPSCVVQNSVTRDPYGLRDGIPNPSRM